MVLTTDSVGIRDIHCEGEAVPDPDTAMQLFRYLLDGMRLNRAQDPCRPTFAVEAKAIYSLLQHGLERR